MTEKLKTLKDLKYEHLALEKDLVNADELKAEAVKWVKDLDLSDDNPDLWIDGGKKEIMMDFFNLTEEDLYYKIKRSPTRRWRI